MHFHLQLFFVVVVFIFFILYITIYVYLHCISLAFQVQESIQNASSLSYIRYLQAVTDRKRTLKELEQNNSNFT